MTAQFRNIEFCGAENIAAAQTENLARHMAYCAEHSPYYRRLFESREIEPSEIDLHNLSDIPFTDKQQLAEYNHEFLAVAREKIVDMVLSSGTSGMPTRIMYSEKDLQRLAYNEQESLSRSGVTADDTVLLTCTLDRCFIAGLAYFMGVRSIGASAVRNGHGTMESHLAVIRRMDPTVLIGVPTFLRKLGYYLEQHNAAPRSTAISRLVCIGEPLRDKKLEMLPLARELEDIWQAKTYSTYASSEIVTTFCECEAQQGGHVVPDLAVVEIVDSQGKPVADGQAGEVVVTPLSVTGMPLVRFKTGDISFLRTEKCSCGRQSARLGPILGRKNQMLKIKGTTLYPQTINAALDGFDGVSEYYIEALRREDSSDELKIHVSVSEQSLTAQRLQEHLQAVIRIKPHISIESEETLRKFVFRSSSRKPTRFFDRRKDT